MLDVVESPLSSSQKSMLDSARIYCSPFHCTGVSLLQVIDDYHISIIRKNKSDSIFELFKKKKREYYSSQFEDYNLESRFSESSKKCPIC